MKKLRMQKPTSLKTRLMLLSALALTLSMLAVGFLLEHSFYSAQVNALKERLKLNSLSVLSAAQPISSGVGEGVAGGVNIPQYLPQPRFNQPGSGLFAALENAPGQRVWQSLSSPVERTQSRHWAAQGQWLYSIVQHGEQQFLRARFGVSWQSGNPDALFNLVLSEDMRPLRLQLQHYRKTLLVLLAALALFILLLQYFILRLGLKPLAQVGDEINNLQQGEQRQLQRHYADELQPLTSSLNQLLASEHHQRERYRNTLADLSHSLKTPLAVLTGWLEQTRLPQPEQQQAAEQLEQMTRTINYQLQRAVSGSQGLTIQRQALLPVCQMICQAMDKVYRDKALNIELDIAEGTEFHGEKNDLMEVLGNLIDNACKYGNTQVSIQARSDQQQLEINIADDGQGVAAEQLAQILQRGQRLDTQLPGQGLGLALVKDILDSYGAELMVSPSSLGGACFTLRFQQHIG